MGLFEGRRPVKHDAGAHPIAGHLRPAEQRRRIAQADFIAKAGAGLFEHRHLFGTAGAVQFVSAGEVAHQDDFFDLAAGLQALVGVAVFGRVQADPVHAGVELEPDGQRLAQAAALDGFELPVGMHHGPEVVLLDQCQLVGLEESLQQQDRLANPRRAQFERFLDAGHGKTVGLILQRFGTPHRTMAICIGLDHGQSLGAADFAGEAVVVAQGLEIDQGTGGTHGEASSSDQVEKTRRERRAEQET
ncbi:hypothetical protein D9M71_535570 [compost metagenome]